MIEEAALGDEETLHPTPLDFLCCFEDSMDAPGRQKAKEFVLSKCPETVRFARILHAMQSPSIDGQCVRQQ